MGFLKFVYTYLFTPAGGRATGCRRAVWSVGADRLAVEVALASGVVSTCPVLLARHNILTR